jgi:aminoglycoside 3-N-acetyltransferase
MMKDDITLYYYDKGSRALTDKDIELLLVNAGLEENDIVMVHSDVASFGKLGDIKDKDEFLQSLLQAFINVIGRNGTLIVPTYTYSFCKNEIFDIKNTKSAVGLFSEFLRTRMDAFRSEDPIFSHAAIGKEAETILKKTGNKCFGKDSFFDRFYKEGGKIVNFGKKFDPAFFDVTFIHYVERAFGVDYRYDKEFSGKAIHYDGTSADKKTVYYVRYDHGEGRDVKYNMLPLAGELEKSGLANRVDVGDSFVMCFSAKDYYDTGFEMLKSDGYAFLEKDPNVLKLENYTFYTGMLDTPDNSGFPVSLDFELSFVNEKERIVQRYSERTEKLLDEAYRKGSLISTNLGQGDFGKRRADDAIEYLLRSFDGDVKDKSFLEIGCADGYLLHRLQLMGARKVLGCEPGPMAKEGCKKFGINIINQFYGQDVIDEEFDIVFSYGVLEHLREAEKFIEIQKKALNEQGTLFVVVPNCENKLRMGDVSVLVHEHWNYFTRSSITRLLSDIGLKEVEAHIGMNDAMIYAWGKKAGADSCEGKRVDVSEEEVFYGFCGVARKHMKELFERADSLEKQGKTLGLYGGGVYLTGILPQRQCPRFFDGDSAKHGKYYPGQKNPVEDPRNLIADKVDELWIAAVDYNDEIIDYLKDDLEISRDVRIFSIKEFLEETDEGEKCTTC